MDWLRGVLALGVAAGLAGCASVQRPPASGPWSPRLAVASPAASEVRGSESFPASGRVGGASDALGRYFPGLGRSVAAAPVPAGSSRPGLGLFARPTQHALPLSARRLTPTGARLASRSPDGLPWSGRGLGLGLERAPSPAPDSASALLATSGRAVASPAAGVRIPAGSDSAAADEPAAELPVALNVRAHPVRTTTPTAVATASARVKAGPGAIEAPHADAAAVTRPGPDAVEASQATVAANRSDTATGHIEAPGASDAAVPRTDLAATGPEAESGIGDGAVPRVDDPEVRMPADPSNPTALDGAASPRMAIADAPVGAAPAGIVEARSDPTAPDRRSLVSSSSPDAAVEGHEDAVAPLAAAAHDDLAVVRDNSRVDTAAPLAAAAAPLGTAVESDGKPQAAAAPLAATAEPTAPASAAAPSTAEPVPPRTPEVDRLLAGTGAALWPAGADPLGWRDDRARRVRADAEVGGVTAAPIRRRIEARDANAPPTADEVRATGPEARRLPRRGSEVEATEAEARDTAAVPAVRRLIDVQDATAQAAKHPVRLLSPAGPGARTTETDGRTAEAEDPSTTAASDGPDPDGPPSLVTPGPGANDGPAPSGAQVVLPAPDPDTGGDPSLAGRPRLPLVRYPATQAAETRAPAPRPASMAVDRGAGPARQQTLPRPDTPRGSTAVAIDAALPPVQFPPSYYGNGASAARDTVRSVTPPPAGSLGSRLLRRVRRLNPFRDDAPAWRLPVARAQAPAPAGTPGDASAPPTVVPGDDAVSRTSLHRDARPSPTPSTANAGGHRHDCPCACRP